VQSGRVELLDVDDKGKPVVIANEVPGEYFGEEPFLPGSRGRHKHYARAVENTKLIKIPKDIITSLIDRDNTVVDKIKIVQNLRQLKMKIPGSKTSAKIKR
jgi:cAMP-binding proteins - catabolite gene activator and regulatory subunit of cAMP-dependent protein kinases